jgi:hypothetical protein
MVTDQADREGHRYAEATYATMHCLDCDAEDSRATNPEWTSDKAGSDRRLPDRALVIYRTGHQLWTGTVHRETLRGRS